jgi:hypothetical protein
MPHPNLELLEFAAQVLQPLLPEIAFIGGCMTALLITDPGAAPVRVTMDVDVISAIASIADYGIFSGRLRALGFQEDTSEDAPICRWRFSGLILDVMPVDTAILGFSNRWYTGALQTAKDTLLANGLTIRAITAPYFLGTKMEAFYARGRKDYFASHDLEDFIAVVDGRATLFEELASAPINLRNFLAMAMKQMSLEPRFLDALPGYLLPDQASQSRIDQLTEKLQALSRLAAPNP